MPKSIISDLLANENIPITSTKEQIKTAYLADERPWIVGYSGGKDSTVVVQLIFETLCEMPAQSLHKKVYIISSDTLIETPLIINAIHQTLTRIQQAAHTYQLPIETHQVNPTPKNSFWVNLIGRGYPSPNQQFRWCTDRLKIEPANTFIMNKVSSFGEVIMILGVREDESTSRNTSIQEHTIDGHQFMRHSTLTNAFVYAPIRKFTVDDVWHYLLQTPSPWGDDNHALHRLYQDATSGECPLIIDKQIKESAGSCGNSRFGCWACTVVTEDKALTGFIQSGHEWMKPLLDFRNWLTTIRDDRTKRMKYRMNGQIYFNTVTIETENNEQYVMIAKKAGRKATKIPFSHFTILQKQDITNYLAQHQIDLRTADDPLILINYEETALDGTQLQKYAQLGLGPYTMATRQDILTRLLQLQATIQHPNDTNYQVITEAELKEIRRIWLQQGDWEDNVPNIYARIPHLPSILWERDDNPILHHDDAQQLEALCQTHHVDSTVMRKLLNLEKDYAGYKIRRGIQDEIAKILKQDYLHL